MKTNETKNRQQRILRIYTSRGLTQGVATLSSVVLWRTVRHNVGRKAQYQNGRKKRLGTKPELPNYDILV